MTIPDKCPLCGNELILDSEYGVNSFYPSLARIPRPLGRG